MGEAYVSPNDFAFRGALSDARTLPPWYLLSDSEANSHEDIRFLSKRSRSRPAHARMNQRVLRGKTHMTGDLLTSDGQAFGRPGIPPRWTSSSKEGVGTAYSTSGRVWFTLSHGILNEVYYPTIDRPQTRDLQFLKPGDTLIEDSLRVVDTVLKVDTVFCEVADL